MKPAIAPAVLAKKIGRFFFILLGIEFLIYTYIFWRKRSSWRWNRWRQLSTVAKTPTIRQIPSCVVPLQNCPERTRFSSELSWQKWWQHKKQSILRTMRTNWNKNYKKQFFNTKKILTVIYIQLPWLSLFPSSVSPFRPLWTATIRCTNKRNQKQSTLETWLQPTS